MASYLLIENSNSFLFSFRFCNLSKHSTNSLRSNPSKRGKNLYLQDIGTMCAPSAVPMHINRRAFLHVNSHMFIHFSGFPSIFLLLSFSLALCLLLAPLSLPPLSSSRRLFITLLILLFPVRFRYSCHIENVFCALLISLELSVLPSIVASLNFHCWQKPICLLPFGIIQRYICYLFQCYRASWVICFSAVDIEFCNLFAIFSALLLLL